jgi:hypothetical protein
MASIAGRLRLVRDLQPEALGEISQIPDPFTTRGRRVLSVGVAAAMLTVAGTDACAPLV